MKKTAAAVKKELEQRLADIEKARKEAERLGLEFHALEEKALLRKIRRESARSPYFYSTAFVSGGPAGMPGYAMAWYANPDPVGYSYLFLSAFFGLGNFFPTVGEAWVGRDERWPSLGSQSFSLAAGASGSTRLDYVVPSVPKTTYYGALVLWRGDYFGTGTLYDHGLMHIEVR